MGEWSDDWWPFRRVYPVSPSKTIIADKTKQNKKKKKKGYAEAGNARNDGNNRIRIGREQQKVKKKTNKSRRETTF